MNKIITIIGSITVSGVILWGLRYIAQDMVRNNPEKVIKLIFDLTGFLLIQVFNLLEWTLNSIL